MKNKKEIESELLDNNFHSKKFPVDILYTEIVEVQANIKEKIKSKKPDIKVRMEKYPWIGKSIHIPLKPISKILNPNKILSK